MAKISLYIVEDEFIIANDLKDQLAGFGYEVRGIDGSGEKAVESIDTLAGKNMLPDIVLVDIKLPGTMDGIEAAKQITKKYNCGIIFFTSLNKNEAFDRSFFLKPYAYLFKPLDMDQVRMAIELANYQRNLEIENKKTIEELKSEIEKRQRAEKENERRLQEKIKTEQKINQLLRSNNQMEMDLINRELATSSIFISQKNKIIGLIRKDVNRQLRKGKTMTKSDFARVLKTIDENVKFENDWYRIKAHFEKIHPGFFDRLRERFPKLTPNDHKLCALLRMNLSTKEISQILKITAPSTEISRIRLRKKLELPKNLNLVQYICNV